MTIVINKQTGAEANGSGLPLLYSFRRCPYAIRARLAIKVSGVQVQLREVLLADKPKEMLACSAKGTVPVLVLPDSGVIDESREIMVWALQQYDPSGWLPSDPEMQAQVDRLIDGNDGDFKRHLDQYKYADRFPEQPMEVYRQQAEEFVAQLERCLTAQRYLTGDRLTMADMAVLPFIRQFAAVDRAWFERADYYRLRTWLDELLATDLFASVMKKYDRWRCGDDAQCL